MSRAVSLTAPTPAAGPSEDDGEELIGTTVADRYLVQGVIGRGGMGVVLEALHAELGQTYALKVLGRQFVRDDAVVRRFIREARTVAQIGHPHIVAVHDLGVLEDGRPYLVMERVRGPTLRERLRQHGALSPAEVAAILAGVAEALEVVHARGIVHRDVKLENIMLAEQHTGPPLAKLLDFGVATMTTPEPGAARITQHGMLLGTPLYLPPEAGEGSSVDARWDVYALGVVCFALMTTRWPFDGDTPLAVLTQKLLHPPPPLSDTERVFDDAVEQVVAAALATAPAARTSSARALIAGLAAAAQRSADGGVRPRTAGAVPHLDTAAARAVSTPATERAEAGARTLAAAGLRPRAPWGHAAVVAVLVAAGSAVVALVALRARPAPVPIAAVADPQPTANLRLASPDPRTGQVLERSSPASAEAGAAPSPASTAAPGVPVPSVDRPEAAAAAVPIPSPSAATVAGPSTAAGAKRSPESAPAAGATRSPDSASPASARAAERPESSTVRLAGASPLEPSRGAASSASPSLDEPGLERRVKVQPARPERPGRPELVAPVPPEPAPRIADPERAARLTREGLDALLAGDLVRAVEVLDQATRADDRHVAAWRALATATDRAGRTARAREAYRRYLALADDREDGRVVERARRRLAELEATR